MAPAPGSHTQKTIWALRCRLNLWREQALLLTADYVKSTRAACHTLTCKAMQWGTRIQITVGTVTGSGTGDMRRQKHAGTHMHTSRASHVHTGTHTDTQTHPHSDTRTGA